MTSRDYVMALGLKLAYDDGEPIYKREFEKNGNLVFITLKKFETIDECYLERKTFYRHKFDAKTKTYGVWGEPKFTFGIKNTSFGARFYKNIDKEQQEYE